MMGKIPQGRNSLRQTWSQGGPQGRTWVAMEKGGDGPLPLSFDIAWVLILSARSLLIKPEKCRRWVQPCAGKGRFPTSIRPKKECIKSCETCFANTLNLNDKGPSMKWVCFPKVLWSFSYLTLTQNKPSEFFECYLFDYYCLTLIDELSIYALYSYAN